MKEKENAGSEGRRSSVDGREKKSEEMDKMGKEAERDEMMR